jgi:Methyltransferase domain
MSRVIMFRNRLIGRPLMVYGTSDTPNIKTLDFLSTTQCRTIAEIGVERGATSKEILRWLNGAGVLHLFDYDDRRKPVTDRLHRLGFSNFVFHGNSRTTLDSYNWSLMKMLKDGPIPYFDYVYLDGAHTWGVDALAFLLIDKLLKPGGYIDFDDYDWTFASSPTVNPRVYPATRKEMTEEQMDTPQVKLIVDLLVRREGHYEELMPDKVFRKLQGYVRPDIGVT